MASFWAHLPKAVEVKSDIENVKENLDNVANVRYLNNTEKQRCVCAKVYPKFNYFIFIF